MISFIVVSSDLRPYVLDTRVKRGAEFSTDLHLVASWIRWRGEDDRRTGKTKMNSAGELGTSGGGTCPSGLQVSPPDQLLVHQNESEWTVFKASIVGAAVKCCYQKVTGACQGRRQLQNLLVDARGEGGR